MRLFAVLAVLLSAALPTRSEFSGITLFDVDCSGGLHLFPDTPLEVDANIASYLSTFNIFADGVYRRARCACPSISDSEVESRFIPGIHSLLRFLEGPTKSTPASCPDAFAQFSPLDDTVITTFLRTFITAHFHPLLSVSIPTVDTCTSDTWNSHGSCQLQFLEPVTKTSLQLIATKCSGSHFPRITIRCADGVCSDLGRLCLTKADCSSGMSCTSILSLPQLLKDLTSLGAISASGDLSSCSGGSHLLTQLFNELATIFDFTGSATPSVSHISVCTPGALDTIELFSALVSGLSPAHDPVSPSLDDCISIAGCDPCNIGDGVCNAECNHPQCQNDGNDCEWKPTLRCPSDNPYHECSGGWKGHCVPTGSGPWGPLSDDDSPNDDDGFNDDDIFAQQPLMNDGEGLAPGRRYDDDFPFVDDDNDDHDDDADDYPVPTSFHCQCLCQGASPDCSDCPTTKHNLCPAPTPRPSSAVAAAAVTASEPGEGVGEVSTGPSPPWPSPPAPTSTPPVPNCCDPQTVTFPALPTYLLPLSTTVDETFFTPSLSVDTPSAGDVNILSYATCDGQMGHLLNDHWGFSVWSKHHQDFMVFLSSTLSAVESCRAASNHVTPLSSAQLATRFQRWQPAMWLFQHSTSGSDAAADPSFSLGNDLSDWLSTRPSASDWTTVPRYDLPASCNYSSYVDRISQPCRLAFGGGSPSGGGGLNSLLRSSGTLSLEVRHCPSSAYGGFPGFAAAYSGQLQAMLNSPTPCESSSDCSDGLVCADVLGEGYYDTPVKGKHRDPIGSLLFGWTNFDDTCSTRDEWGKDVRSVLFDIGGKKSDGQSGTKFCLVDLSVVQSRKAYKAWKKDNVNEACVNHTTTDANCVTNPISINGLTSSTLNLSPAGNAPTPAPPTPPPTPHSGESLLESSVTMPAGVTPEQFDADLAARFREAIVQAMSKAVPGLSLNHVFLKDSHTVPKPSSSQSSMLASGVGSLADDDNQDLEAVFVVEVPTESVPAVQSAVAADGSFTSSIGSDLERANVIPPGTANGVSVGPAGTPKNPSGHSSNIGTILGGVAGAVALVGVAVLVFLFVKRQRSWGGVGSEPMPLLAAASNGTSTAAAPSAYGTPGAPPAAYAVPPQLHSLPPEDPPVSRPCDAVSVTGSVTSSVVYARPIAPPVSAANSDSAIRVSARESDPTNMTLTMCSTCHAETDAAGAFCEECGVAM